MATTPRDIASGRSPGRPSSRPKFAPASADESTSPRISSAIVTHHPDIAVELGAWQVTT